MITISNSLFLGPLLNGTYAPEDPDEDEFPLVNLVTKFFSTVVLHLSTQPKMVEALERLRYIKHHPYKFERITIPIFICFLKLFIEL